ncbi:MAG TPA: ABC transporter permease [Streptosporangiaceae bacterium]|nr:ABC transporter permease [Streptosporangiaceae bacterium]
MRNPLAKHPWWRQLVVVAVVLPLMIVLAVLAFAWPNARLAPRGLPVGIVGTSPASQQAVAALTRAEPGAFSLALYADQATARRAVEDRDVYGAFEITSGRITVLEASAASPTVAQLLTSTGQQLAAGAAAARRAPAAPVSAVDVVPLSRSDPRGLVLSSALLPLTICSIIMAAAVALLLRFRPAWRQILSLLVVSATAGLGAILITEGFLGALPHGDGTSWAALALTVLAVSAPTAGLIALIGPPGLGLGAGLMIFIGNPFSGATSAPQLLPTAVSHIGQWLPPGAGASLLRSTAYFGGRGAGGHLVVLIVWAVLGLAAILAGHHAPFRFAASRPSPPPGEPVRTATVAAPGAGDQDDWFTPGDAHPRHARSSPA